MIFEHWCIQTDLKYLTAKNMFQDDLDELVIKNKGGK